MSDDNNGKFNLSRRKALAGIGAAGAAVGLGGIGTVAQLSDTESTATKFTAGAIDGTISSTVSYNGSTADGNSANVSTGGFGNTDSGVGIPIHFTDVKPGDFGCVNFTVEVTNNPAWVASSVSIEDNFDGDNYEPEVEVDDEVTAANAGPEKEGDYTAQTTTQGELAQNIYTIPYYDNDGSCTFFDPSGNASLPADYAGATPSAFWSNSQDNGDSFTAQTPNGGGPVSATGTDGTEYYLAARSLKDVAENVAAVDTAHWSAGADASLGVQTATDGASTGYGSVVLAGNGSSGGSPGNNTQGVAPLQPSNTLNFGYDFHIPFDTGNEIMGDTLTLELGFDFLQTRHTKAPAFGEYHPGGNLPSQ